MIGRLRIVLLISHCHAAMADELQNCLSVAKAGHTVILPAGEFRGGVTLPMGVSLQGAGIGKTVIDAGITLRGGRGEGFGLYFTRRGACGQRC